MYPHPGFGFVTYHQTGNTSYPVSYLDKAVSGAVAVFNSMECEAQMNHSNQPVLGPQDFKTKFKVVKVETTKPLNRGRWTCFDFTDKNTSSSSTSSASEVSRSSAPVTSSTTSASSKPTTKTSDLVVASSRPGSTLPREPAEPSSVITSDSNNVASNDLANHPVKSDPEQSETVSSAPVTEDKEVETLGPKVEVRGSSAVPEAVPRQVTAAGGAAPPPAAANYGAAAPAAAYPSPTSTAVSTAPAPTSSSSATAGLNISLSQQSVPVITPTPSQVSVNILLVESRKT